MSHIGIKLSPKENPPSKKSSKIDWKKRLQKEVTRARKLVNNDIWESKHLGRETKQARFYHFMRILVLTVQGLRRNNLGLQSAALTFYSLIGIGPLVALGIMISSFILEQTPENSTNPNQPAENRAVEAITRAIA